MQPHIAEAITRSVRPSGRDVLEARAVILNLLADGSEATESDMVAALERERELPAAGSEKLVITYTDGQWPAPSGCEPPLVRKRLRHAVREALIELERTAVIVAPVGDVYGSPNDHLMVERDAGGSKTTGTLSFVSPMPTLGVDPGACRWALVDGAGPRSDIARATMADGLDDLLGSRGLEVLREAIACFHQGRFIAAVDLLAAASEAAWFGLAAAAAGRDTKLDQLVERGEMAAEVIERTTGVVQTTGVLRSAARNDVRAQAARYRDLRNYGLHPVGDPDADREGAFTEVGAAALFMTARRYFVVLDEARVALLRLEGEA